MLQKQVRDAHAAQRDIEVKLEAEQQVTRKYRDDAVQLREKVSSQDLEIIRLQSQLLKAERERDEVLSGKAAAEESHKATLATVDATLFDFYVHCILGRGSLSFLGPEYEVTLAEVWEAIIDMLGGAGYAEADLEATYLNESARSPRRCARTALRLGGLRGHPGVRDRPRPRRLPPRRPPPAAARQREAPLHGAAVHRRGAPHRHARPRARERPAVVLPAPDRVLRVWVARRPHEREPGRDRDHELAVGRLPRRGLAHEGHHCEDLDLVPRRAERDPAR